MAKREIKSLEKRLAKIKTWHLVVLLIMFGFISATFLRLNNVGMRERRDAVISADKAGDVEQIERRLYDLQRYVTSHMNADPGKIALEETYKRDNEAHKAQLEKQSDANPQGNVYKKAADVCDPIGQAGGWRWPDPRYTDCIDRELEKYPSAGELQLSYRPIPTETYYHTFVSPLWSPDFAGLSLLASAIIALAIIIRLITLGILKIVLKFRYRQV